MNSAREEAVPKNLLERVEYYEKLISQHEVQIEGLKVLIKSNFEALVALQSQCKDHQYVYMPRYGEYEMGCKFCHQAMA